MEKEKAIRVWATFTVIGFHNWPAAPDSVSYLRNVHRHNFKITVALKVPELDRSEEFHTLKARASNMLHTLYSSKIDVEERVDALDFKNDSCETIADKLGNLLYEAYKLPVAIEVSEDSEHGGIVEIS